MKLFLLTTSYALATSRIARSKCYKPCQQTREIEMIKAYSFILVVVARLHGRSENTTRLRVSGNKNMTVQSSEYCVRSMTTPAFSVRLAVRF